MKKMILLTGIHGVGKGYISDCIRSQVNLQIYEASKLIKQSGNISDFNKKVSNINSNQDILRMAIDNYVKEDLFILDGHTCLLNEEGEIEKIDLEYLRKFNITGIIFIYDNGEKIKERLYKRDNTNYDIKKICLFQKLEYENSMKLSKDLNIKFLPFKNGNNINSIINFLKEV